MRGMWAIAGAALLCAGCATLPDAEPAKAFILKDEKPQYSFSYEAAADVMELPGLPGVVAKDAAKQHAQLIKDNAQLRKDLPDDPRDVQLYYEASWTRAGDAGGLASAEMNMSAYGGGAHPITGFSSRIVDKSTGARLRLSDLFVKPVAETGLPAALCKGVADEKAARETPVDNLGEPLACDGKNPNVRMDGPVVFVTSTEAGKAAGLRFLFGPYEVGSYAEGPYVIDVPLTAFAKDLKPKYAAGFGGAPSPDDPANPEDNPEEPAQPDAAPN